jgi:hypothetical protein
MPERLEPASAVRHLVLPNADQFIFDLIFALGKSTGLFYGTIINSSRSFAAGPYTLLTASKMLLNIRSLLPLELHERVHILGNISDLTPAQFKELHGLSLNAPLTGIAQFRAIQMRVLNMYLHHEQCVAHAQSLERRYARPFEFIVLLREDAHFFMDLRLAVLTRIPMCDIVVKNCLGWGGLNMRFQLVRRATATGFLRDRLSYYASLVDAGRHVYNTEQFELSLSQHLNLSVCQRDVDSIPVAVARHSADGRTCFSKYEVIDHRSSAVNTSCIPHGYSAFVAANLC